MTAIQTKQLTKHEIKTMGIRYVVGMTLNTIFPAKLEYFQHANVRTLTYSYKTHFEHLPVINCKAFYYSASL